MATSQDNAGNSASKDSIENMEEKLRGLSLEENSKISRQEQQQQNEIFLTQELAKTPFTIFRDIKDYGFCGWNPRGKYRKIGHASAEDISSMIDSSSNANPSILVDLTSIQSQLPMAFYKNIPKKKAIMNKYPFDIPHLASLHVLATREKINFQAQKIRFCLGGSVLHVLSKRAVPSGTTYIVVQIPGTSIVQICKHSVYKCAYVEPGFQFERLLTGQRMDVVPSNPAATVEHIHAMTITGKGCDDSPTTPEYRVLFMAEVDAREPSTSTTTTTTTTNAEASGGKVDAATGGRLVEFKATAQVWNTKVSFQLISSGSTRLIQGRKNRNGNLASVHSHSLSTQIQKALELVSSSSSPDRITATAESLERGILDNLVAIDTQITQYPPGTVCILQFQKNKNKNNLCLTPATPRSKYDILPSKEVIAELLHL